MVKKGEYQKKNFNQGGFEQKGPGEQNGGGKSMKPSNEQGQKNNYRSHQDSQQRQQNQRQQEDGAAGAVSRTMQETGAGRENQHPRNYQRDNHGRYNGNSGQNSYARQGNRVKGDESIDDISADISRIEKEIQLELKEIRSMRLGL